LTGLTHAQGGTTFADYGYAFDAAGRLIEESTLAETRKYYYDAGGQLTAVDSSLAGRDETYAYDKTGNRTSNGGEAGTGNRLLEDANWTYTYDAEGNRTQRTSKADGSREIYWWDHRNRLVRVNFRTATNVLTQAVAYDYDAFDNLIRRRVDGNGDGTFEESQSFVLDLGGKGGLDDVVLTFDDSGSVAHRYLHGGGVDELWADESATDGLLWALADRQGTVNDWAEHDSGTSTTGITNHVEFDAYGNIVSQTNAGHEITAGGYTGRYHDPLTGLRYHRRRWTDPATGWLSPDPGGFAMGDVNLYRYVGNGPGNGVDPSGLDIWVETDGFHVDFALPVYDLDGNTIGWKAYSYGPTPFSPTGIELEQYCGLVPGVVTTSQHPVGDPDWNPDDKYDYRIETTYQEDLKMAAEAEKWDRTPPNYNVVDGTTCVGYTFEVMDAGGLFPPWAYPLWRKGSSFERDFINRSLDPTRVVRLPNHDSSR
jgi:RHS repeat-associated protein